MPVRFLRRPLSDSMYDWGWMQLQAAAATGADKIKCHNMRASASAWVMHALTAPAPGAGEAPIVGGRRDEIGKDATPLRPDVTRGPEEVHRTVDPITCFADGVVRVAVVTVLQHNRLA